MIGYLVGRIVGVDSDHLILDVNGVGYELLCSQSTLNMVQGRDEVRLWVYTHVREDAIQLFGFATPAEKQLFLSLIKVNGIGPKMATTVLSAGPHESLIRMIDEGDVRALTQLPKVGKKTAEQIILSLRGKLVFASQPAGASAFPARTEIISALVNLGFRLTDVESVVDQMPAKVEVQEGVRLGLRALSNV